MPQFRYEITDNTGKPMRGVMDAASEGDVRQRLVSRGYSVNTIIPVGGPAPQSQAVPRMAAPQSVSGQVYGTNVPAKEMTVFFRGLSSYLQSGTAIYQAIVSIGAQSPNRGLRFVCERMAAHVQMGQKLSTAMLEFPRVFPQHVVGVVMAGELGGFLPIVVGDVALDYELAQRASVRYMRSINIFLWINALAPLPLAPVPAMIFSQRGISVDIDTISSAEIIHVVLNCIGYGMKVIGIPLILLVTAYFVAASVLRQPSMRPSSDRWLLKVPWAGKASRERSLASFTRVLWRLQNAGIQPIQSWDAASRAASNVFIAQRLYSQLGAVKSGCRFSEALASTGLFTSEDQRVLAMGETNGQVPDTLQRMAAFYEDAAAFSAGRAKWLGLRVAILANLVSIGIVSISVATVYPAMMDWVEKAFSVQ